MMKMTVCMVTIMLLAGLCISVSADENEFEFNIGKDDMFEFRVGVGPLAGETTYQIGGTVDTARGTEEYWFPISELAFPLNVAQASVDMSFTVAKTFVFSLGATKNLTTDAGTMKDSDWVTGSNTSQLDIYSESDAELDMLMLDVNVLYGIMNGPTWSLGAGAGFLYQDFSYECGNFTQSYPSSPWLGSDYYSGLGITYDVTFYIPYIMVAGDLVFKEKFDFSAKLSLSPYVYAEDTDNHVLRDIISYGEYHGVAAMISLAGRYNFSNRWFVDLSLDARSIYTTGTQKNYVPVTWSHDIDADLTSVQGALTLAVGVDL